MLAFLHYNFITFCASLTKIWFGLLQQGSAADVAMCAMLEIAKNARLKQLGWKLLLQVMFMLFSSSLLPPYFILDPKKIKEGREKENSRSRIPTHFPLFNSAGFHIHVASSYRLCDWTIKWPFCFFNVALFLLFALLQFYSSIGLCHTNKGWERERGGEGENKSVGGRQVSIMECNWLVIDISMFANRW